MTDEELIAQAAKGDAKAFGVFYDRRAPAAFGLCLKILGSRPEAEDALQDVFLQAWAQAPRFDSLRAGAAAWLMVIARSRCLDRLRRRKTARTDRTSPLEISGDDGDWERPLGDGAAPLLESLVNEESRSRVRSALAALPEEQSVPLRAAYFDGLSQSEIAGKTGLPLGTVKTRMRLGLKKLAEALA